MLSLSFLRRQLQWYAAKVPSPTPAVPIINFSEDMNHFFSLVPFFTDPDGDTLMYTVLSGFSADLSIVVDNTTGLVSLSSTQDFFGFLLNNVTFKAADPAGLFARM